MIPAYVQQLLESLNEPEDKEDEHSSSVEVLDVYKNKHFELPAADADKIFQQRKSAEQFLSTMEENGSAASDLEIKFKHGYQIPADVLDVLTESDVDVVQ